MITVEWANPEKTIIRWRFSQPWTWDEFYNAKRQMDVMVESVVGSVDSIFLTSKTQLLPANPTIHLRKIIASQHERSNLVVLVGANRFLSAILQVMTRWVPGFSSQLRFTGSEQEAFAIIAEDRKTRHLGVTRPLPALHSHSEHPRQLA